jgi:hypothetical protein
MACCGRGVLRAKKVCSSAPPPARVCSYRTPNYASLSDGRIAYATRDEGQTSLDVLSLATGKARTIVTFSGAGSMEGFGLGRAVLAWAQQNYM